MNITPKQYARALFELMLDKDKKQSEAILSDFAEFMISQNDTRKLGQIENEFNELWNKEKDINEFVIISAHELSQSLSEKLKKILKNATGASDVILHKAVDEKILGGLIIRCGDKVLDISLARRLEGMKAEMEK
jgi:F-type H+-transporting ATPase subunit delta